MKTKLRSSQDFSLCFHLGNPMLILAICDKKIPLHQRDPVGLVKTSFFTHCQY
jgi:hypothetical protein